MYSGTMYNCTSFSNRNQNMDQQQVDRGVDQSDLMAEKYRLPASNVSQLRPINLSRPSHPLASMPNFLENRRKPPLQP